MENLKIEATPQSPSVLFDLESGRLEFRGRSLPTNSLEFYEPILGWLKEYAQAHPQSVEVFFRMEYFNTSSAKYLLDFFKILEGMHREGTGVRVLWSYEEDDEEMEELGEDFQSILDLPFHFVTAEE